MTAFYPPQCVLPIPGTTDITYIDLGVKIITGTSNIYTGENDSTATCPPGEGSLPMSGEEYAAANQPAPGGGSVPPEDPECVDVCPHCAKYENDPKCNKDFTRKYDPHYYEGIGMPYPDFV